jgi:hypothetical protein
MGEKKRKERKEKSLKTWAVAMLNRIKTAKTSTGSGWKLTRT